MTKIHEQIAKLHEHAMQVCIVSTGAGAGVQNLISQVPGASATLLECIFPYSKQALIDFLGFEPEKFCNEKTALQMAERAWKRAVEILKKEGKDIQHAVGLGLTAVIASDRPTRGDYRAFIAVRTSNGNYSAAVSFRKHTNGSSVLGRIEEGDICDRLAVNMLLRAAGIEQAPLPKWFFSDNLTDVPEGVILNPTFAEVESDFVAGNVFYFDGRIADQRALDPEKHILFPGSFDPLHEGHLEIAREVNAKTGKDVVFAITDQHPDKGVLHQEVIQKRLEQFRWKNTVTLMGNLPFYLDKANAFPGFAFILGTDTLVRMLDQNYYKKFTVTEMLQKFQELRTTFFVASRRNGEIVTLEHLLPNIPAEFHGMFTQLSTVIDVSSTELRKMAKV